MKKNNLNKELFDFIEKSTCAFTCIDEIKKELLQNEYQELFENEEWNFNKGKYFVIRNDASIIAFEISEKHNNSFNIVTTHCDTPGFNIKPKSEIYEYNYLKLNITPYGGILNYAWLDRPLSLAGRIIYKENDKYKKIITSLNYPLCVIPSEAIHQNSSANSNLDLDIQKDLIPIISLKDEKNIIRNSIKKYLNINKEIELLDYDLYLYNLDKPKFIGNNKELILSPRIDNLSCTFIALKSLLKQENQKNINILCIFNSEEIGSLTEEGADSTFLKDTLERISKNLNIDYHSTLHNSLIISADNSHAVHPNHPAKSDINNQGYINKGILITKEKNSTTNSISSTIFKDICKKAKVPFQDYTSRNDLDTGSTLSGINLRHISIDTVEIGLAQLAMHSSNEIIGSSDTLYLYKALKEFYNLTIKKEKNEFSITK